MFPIWGLGRRIEERPKTVSFPGTEVVVMVEEVGVAPGGCDGGLAALENDVTRRGRVGGVFVW